MSPNVYHYSYLAFSMQRIQMYYCKRDPGLSHLRCLTTDDDIKRSEFASVRNTSTNLCRNRSYSRCEGRSALLHPQTNTRLKRHRHPSTLPFCRNSELPSKSNDMVRRPRSTANLDRWLYYEELQLILPQFFSGNRLNTPISTDRNL